MTACSWRIRPSAISPHTPRQPLPLAPADEGIRRMDLATGKHTLIVTMAQLRQLQPVASMERAFHWVTHLEIAPGSARFLFLHRWTECIDDETRWLHRLFTVNPTAATCACWNADHPLPPLRGFEPPSRHLRLREVRLADCRTRPGATTTT